MQRRYFIKTLLVASVKPYLTTKNENWQFRDGDRVCFIGDSITHRGLWLHYLETFYRIRFPERNIQFINCGIGGDTTGSLLKRLDYDILVHKPTVAVVMIGMNDSKNEYYQESHTEAELDVERERIVKRYRADYEKLIKKLKEAGTERFVLATPTPYDQTVKVERTAWVGKNDTLKLLADEVRRLAQQWQVPVVDFFTPINEANLRYQQTKPTFTLSGQDRVHPEALGHELMTTLFVKNQHFEAANHRIKTNKNQKPNFTFNLPEVAFPYPISNPQLVDFAPTDFLTKQRFSITHLPKGRYQVAINDSIVGVFAQQNLNRGIIVDVWGIASIRESAQKIQTLNFEKYELITQLRDLRAAEVLFYDAKIDITNDQQRQQAIEKMTNPRRKKLMQDYPELLLRKPSQVAHIALLEQQIQTFQSQLNLTIHLRKV